MRAIRFATVVSLCSALAGESLIVKSVTVQGTGSKVNFETQVGSLFDTRAIERDVRRLWDLGGFEDIRVKTSQESDGIAVLFEVVESPRWRLHEIRLGPSSFGLQPALPEGASVNRLRAHEVALQAERQLRAEGYVDARVDFELARFGQNEVDLRLVIRAGAPVRVREVEFTGEPKLDPKELRAALRALRPRRMLPGIPGLWDGRRIYPAYAPQAVDSDLARLRSLYISRGYLDATVRVENTEIQGTAARIRVDVRPGLQYSVRSWAGLPSARELCVCLLAQRREAERQGVLDFSVRLDVERAGTAANPTASIDRGRPYRVGRIDFSGAPHYKDATLRRNFLLDEAQPLDQGLLRKSIARLNRTTFFEPIDAGSLAIRTNERTGLAEVQVRLIERKRGGWKLSGPVGPMSFAGPLQAAISSRLPSWGSGVLELSTYTASFSLFAFAGPIAPLLSVTSKGHLLPLLSLQRPFSPGEGWRSGFLVAPQLGWRATALSYATAQLQQGLLPLLVGDRALEPELPVSVGDGAMLCQPAGARLALLRSIAAVGLRFLGAASTIL